MRNVIAILVLSATGVLLSAGEASAFGKRKKGCAPAVVAAPVVAAPACGCGSGVGTVLGTGLGTAYPSATSYSGGVGYPAPIAPVAMPYPR